MEELFLSYEPPPEFMNKDEYFKRSQKVLESISMSYSNSWGSIRLSDGEYPDESICEKCKGFGICKINGEEKQCKQDRIEGECFYDYFDSEDFILSIESQMEELHNLLGIDGITG